MAFGRLAELQLEIILLGVFSICWLLAIVVLLGLVPVAGTLNLDLYSYYSVAAVSRLAVGQRLRPSSPTPAGGPLPQAAAPELPGGAAERALHPPRPRSPGGAERGAPGADLRLRRLLPVLPGAGDPAGDPRPAARLGRDVSRRSGAGSRRPLVMLLAASTAVADPGAKLGKGKFLVAKRHLWDPNFTRTVVLLVDHGPEGAMGLVVNRSSEVKIETVLPDLEGVGGRPDTVFLGGPVAREMMILLLRADRQPEGTVQRLRRRLRQLEPALARARDRRGGAAPPAAGLHRPRRLGSGAARGRGRARRLADLAGRRRHRLRPRHRRRCGRG